jgi:acyl-CoA synthetase (AMP-forming)/AMP-acid ligase II
MICAFYGCVMAGAVPVPIEVPITRRDAGSTQIGFLLGSCGVSLALTSEACYKGLPKATGGSGGGGSSSDVLQFKGWPRLHWFITEHLARPPKEWLPPQRLTDDTPAYVEYTTQQDGSVLGVSVTRTAMLAMARTLTLACGYTEGEIMVCVLDFKRDAGLWHSIIASVFNGMHVIFIPYALMKINPASWMQMITKHRASIAVCKSRDLHWGLLATKDHRDLNLSSLRLLLVADGANPWSLSSCDQFLSVFQALFSDPLVENNQYRYRYPHHTVRFCFIQFGRTGTGTSYRYLNKNKIAGNTGKDCRAYSMSFVKINQDLRIRMLKVKVIFWLKFYRFITGRYLSVKKIFFL